MGHKDAYTHTHTHRHGHFYSQKLVYVKSDKILENYFLLFTIPLFFRKVNKFWGDFSKKKKKFIYLERIKIEV